MFESTPDPKVLGEKIDVKKSGFQETQKSRAGVSLQFGVHWQRLVREGHLPFGKRRYDVTLGRIRAQCPLDGQQAFHTHWTPRMYPSCRVLQQRHIFSHIQTPFT